jgi:broad specificity phosphatase PhoE
VILVRHGRAIARTDVPTDAWPLDPAYLTDISLLRAVVPDLPVVCSDMRRAIDTAQYFGEPTIDPRLGEVARPWTDAIEGAVARYLRGEAIEGWESQADARARFRSVVDDHGRAIYVTHGTVLALYLASIVPTLDALQFWSELRNPDAWELDGNGLVRLSAGGD